MFKIHVEDIHEATVRLDFLVSLHFLGDDEIDILSIKLESRVEKFVESLGQTNVVGNVFERDVEITDQFCEV